MASAETMHANRADELKKIHKQLRADGYKKEYDGYVEKWTRREWTKDSDEKTIYVEIDF